jgi:hypothetical protein
MTTDTFKAGLKVASELGEGIVLGGGEPTLHPDFFAFLGLALGNSSDEEGGVWMATNGTVTETALKLANMAKKGILGVCLSRTQWHKEQKIQPDPRVLKAFEGIRRGGWNDRSNDLREVREITGDRGVPFAVGRAAEWGAEGCACDGLHVDPHGTLWECGCKLVSMGTVFKPEIPESYFERDEKCSRLVIEPAERERAMAG